MTRREKLQSMLAREPQDVFLNYALAMELQKEGDLAAAAAQLDKVLSIDPAYVGAYLQIGLVLNRGGRAEEAKAYLARGVKAAQTAGNTHAANEMNDLLTSLP